jgi:hypothetical protein
MLAQIKDWKRNGSVYSLWSKATEPMVRVLERGFVTRYYDITIAEAQEWIAAARNPHAHSKWPNHTLERYSETRCSDTEY